MKLPIIAIALSALVASCVPAYAVVCVPQRDADGKIARSAAAVREFRKANPCPATGHTTGACKGYVVDHVKPLCACGADAPSNMQWQTVAASRLKDKDERRLCNQLSKEK